MNVTLTSELEKYIQDKVNGGLYASASEVIRESLRHMHAKEAEKKVRIQQLNSAIEAGFQELREGKGMSGQQFRQRLDTFTERLLEGDSGA